MKSKKLSVGILCATSPDCHWERGVGGLLLFSHLKVICLIYWYFRTVQEQRLQGFRTIGTSAKKGLWTYSCCRVKSTDITKIIFLEFLFSCSGTSYMRKVHILKGVFSAPKNWDVGFRSLNCSILKHHKYVSCLLILFGTRPTRGFSMGLTARNFLNFENDDITYTYLHHSIVDIFNQLDLCWLSFWVRLHLTNMHALRTHTFVYFCIWMDTSEAAVSSIFLNCHKQQHDVCHVKYRLNNDYRRIW